MTTYRFFWWGRRWYNHGWGLYRFFLDDLSEGGVYEWSLGVGFFEIRKRQKPRHVPLPYAPPPKRKMEKLMIFDGFEKVEEEPITKPMFIPDALRLEANRIRKAEADRHEQTDLAEKVEGYKILFAAAPHDIHCASQISERDCNCWKARA